MQTFSFKTAKLTWRVTVEVDRRWVRAALPKGQVHIDFNLIDRLHYWVTQSRGAALTGHLVIRDRQGRKLALQCSGFGMDGDFVEFLRASSAILAAIGEVRPELPPVRRGGAADHLLRRHGADEGDGHARGGVFGLGSGRE